MPSFRGAVALAVAAVLGVAVSSAGAAPAPPTDVTAVVAGACSSSVQVPDDYLGLSIEWSMVPHWFGTSRLSAVPATVELLRSLHAGPDGGVLRIGGNSQDGYRWDPHASSDGSNKLFSGVITTGMVDALFEVARRSGWKVVLGLNLKADRPEDAVALTRYALQEDRLHNLLAVELGNEPNAYFKSDVPGYLARFGSYLEALGSDPYTQQVPIAGPALSNQADVAYLHDLEGTHGARIGMLTWHHYANRPTLSRLLEEEVMTQWTDRIKAVDNAAGLTPTRMDEGNSVGRGGMDRVSNVMGTTAWQVDALLTGAVQGLAGYNVHAWDEHYYPGSGWTARYTPFVVRDRQAIPRPTFYAMALLRDLGGKRLCRAMTTNDSDSAVKAWTATDPATGRISVYLVNKSQTGRDAIVLRVPGEAGGAARVSRITDPGGCAGKDTSIDGARLPPSGSFSWTGAPVTPNVAGGYDVSLEPCQSVRLDLGAP